jgi:NADH-quinone oxidoreductase subunit N
MENLVFKPVVIPEVEWWSLLPVGVVIVTGIIALVVEMFRPQRQNGPIVAVSLIGLVAAFALLIPQLSMAPLESFADMVVRDRPGVIFQMLLIIGAFITILFSENYLRRKRIPFGEFYPLALWSLSGGMLMVATNNLLMLFLGLEVLSIALYCMAGMSRQEAKSEESALKYFLLGAFSSAFLLYGIAFVFGASGTVHLDGIAAVLQDGNATAGNMTLFGIGLILVGLCFKAAFVPFHQWTPDVYQGAPTNVTAFMAAVSKIAAIGALYRVLTAAAGAIDFWLPILFWVAILTMTVGNLIALAQKDVKRILGYSSIAHAGYLLVALLAHLRNPTEIGIGTTAFYLLAYSLATVGAFAVIGLVAQDGKETTRLQDLNGLWKRAPLAAGAMVVFMMSLIGVPPTGGFFGKAFIFSDALSADLTWLAIALAVNSAISLYYYLGILKAAFVDEEQERPVFGQMGAALKTTVVACAVGIFLVMIFAGPVLDASNEPTLEEEPLALNVE